MGTRVIDILRRPTIRPLFDDQQPTLSSKQWTDEFAPILPRNIKIRSPTYQRLDRTLGLGDPEVDQVGLSKQAFPLNYRPNMVITEGDVTVDFNQNIIPAVDLAFCAIDPAREACPTLWPQSMRKADQRDSDSSFKVVDYQMTMSHQERSLEGPVMIGEMKRPRTIIPREWTGETRQRSLTLRLGRELRA